MIVMDSYGLKCYGFLFVIQSKQHDARIVLFSLSLYIMIIDNDHAVN